MASLWDICLALPNGLHDARLSRIDADYAEGSVRLFVDVWTGDLHSRDESVREAYTSATITLTGLAYLVMEPSALDDGEDPIARLLTIDAGPLSDLREEGRPGLPPPSAPGTFENWIYVKQWNSFIYVAARDAALTWSQSATG